MLVFAIGYQLVLSGLGVQPKTVIFAPGCAMPAMPESLVVRNTSSCEVIGRSFSQVTQLLRGMLQYWTQYVVKLFYFFSGSIYVRLEATI